MLSLMWNKLWAGSSEQQRLLQTLFTMQRLSRAPQIICKSHTPSRFLCASIHLGLVALAWILRNELTQKMFLPPSSSPQPNQIAWQIWILGEDQSLGDGLAVLHTVYVYVYSWHC